ncbi:MULTISPECIES: NaeI family type II restriction endonuclease [unclassified Streptomyces]|uniref:NaeI family type II restriction endonuclease n=1 Tax=unclassified Streptomyces TaxID=2593676 RepID=UPI0022B62725|nr:MULTISPECIES: NaeI family type II restriction endonuclease [unclassified Streptomyces]MCZ7417512.1 NaeI family type II restriction endonuclease [Streptomyces sp. WMMC897]MCZ7432659.1 NaeI family type II restriction endonuclease [Streptomyces sp. WMMC1477]
MTETDSLFPRQFADLSAAANIAAVANDDAELVTVAAHLKALDPSGKRFAAVLRDTIDQLLNGEATGRYDWNTLFKTEKTHAGTLVEINIQREFQLADGRHMDYSICGIDVDCKYSQQFGGWMIPPEATGHICLLLWADDHASRWSAGLMRIQRDALNDGNNRDRKLTIRAACRNQIHWLWSDAALPENVLLHMNPADREAVLSQPSGQHRVNELFRRAQNRPIGRNVVRTVAQQKDYMKRVRGNGGARTAVKTQGIVIMGDYATHRHIARSLGVCVPDEGEFVSVRVAPATADHDERPGVILEGQRWVQARPQDPVVPAPTLPSHKK